MSKNKISGKILITGGTGSWGHELTKKLLENNEVTEIIIVSRNEHKQVEMERSFNHNKLKFVICDIRSLNNLLKIMEGVDVVFHLAAMKHVHVCELNSWQTVETNIIGTQNVIDSGISSGVKLIVDVSTDKAVEPHNIYGITKACAEKLIINAQHNYNTKTNFVCVRAGNVVGTNGSIFPLFKKQIMSNNCVTITDPKMTRFVMKTNDAIELIFQAVEKCIGGETFVMKMPSVQVKQIAEAMIEFFGNNDTKIHIIGSRPGEKTHEKLLSAVEVKDAFEFDDKYYVILPEINREKYHYKDKIRKIDILDYSSLNTSLLEHVEILKIINSEQAYW